jgi:agmatinase
VTFEGNPKRLRAENGQASGGSVKGTDFVGGDLVEVAPQYDATSNTAHAGAQVPFEILSLMVFGPSISGRT